MSEQQQPDLERLRRIAAARLAALDDLPAGEIYHHGPTCACASCCQAAIRYMEPLLPASAPPEGASDGK